MTTERPQIALVMAGGATIAIQNPEEARLACQLMGEDPNKCIRLVDFYPARVNGLDYLRPGEVRVEAAEDLSEGQEVICNSEGRACLPKPLHPASGITRGEAKAGELVLVQNYLTVWDPPK